MNIINWAKEKLSSQSKRENKKLKLAEDVFKFSEVQKKKKNEQTLQEIYNAIEKSSKNGCMHITVKGQISEEGEVKLSGMWYRVTINFYDRFEDTVTVSWWNRGIKE